VADELATARDVLDSAGVTFISHVEPHALDPEVERTFALALREAVTNVIRHARARRCEVTLEHDETSVRLIVQDDGVGGEMTEGVGLSGMRARMAAIGGTFVCEGHLGTRLVLTAPRRHVTRDRAAS
jgi:two-component system sensor histidine kinase DesK